MGLREAAGPTIPSISQSFKPPGTASSEVCGAKTAISFRAHSKMILAVGFSALNCFRAENGVGWYVITRRALAAIASSITFGVRSFVKRTV